jgi:hypothetical protein
VAGRGQGVMAVVLCLVSLIILRERLQLASEHALSSAGFPRVTIAKLYRHV